MNVFDVTAVLVQYSSAHYASGVAVSPPTGAVAAPATGATASDAAITAPVDAAMILFFMSIRMIRFLPKNRLRGPRVAVSSSPPLE